MQRALPTRSSVKTVFGGVVSNLVRKMRAHKTLPGRVSGAPVHQLAFASAEAEQQAFDTVARKVPWSQNPAAYRIQRERVLDTGGGHACDDQCICHVDQRSELSHLFFCVSKNNVVHQHVAIF